MKKFFIALLKGLGYLGIYLGIQTVVSYVFGAVKGMMLSMEYAAKGLNIQDPEVMGRYMEEMMDLVGEIVMPALIVSGLLTIGVICLIFVCRKKKLTKELSLRKFQPGAVLPIVLMGLGLNVITGTVLALLPEEILSSYLESSSALTSDMGVSAIIATVIMAPLVEEMVLRGLVYTRMKKGMPIIGAMIISSILFGLLHGHWLWAIYTALFGMMLAWTYERTQSLLSCILFHFSYNLCSVLQTAIPETSLDVVWIAILAAAVVFTAVGLFLFVKVPKAEVPVEETVAVTVDESVVLAEEVKENF